MLQTIINRINTTQRTIKASQFHESAECTSEQKQQHSAPPSTSPSYVHRLAIPRGSSSWSSAASSRDPNHTSRTPSRQERFSHTHHNKTSHTGHPLTSPHGARLHSNMTRQDHNTHTRKQQHVRHTNQPAHERSTSRPPTHSNTAHIRA